MKWARSYLSPAPEPFMGPLDTRAMIRYKGNRRNFWGKREKTFRQQGYTIIGERKKYLVLGKDLSLTSFWTLLFPGCSKLGKWDK